jgi:hypothetical protein
MTRKLPIALIAAAAALSLFACDRSVDRIGRDESKSPRTAQAPEVPPGSLRDRASAIPPAKDPGAKLTPEESKRAAGGSPGVPGR